MNPQVYETSFHGTADDHVAWTVWCNGGPADSGEAPSIAEAQLAAARALEQLVREARVTLEKEVM
jgi:hypothetical protein